MNSLRFLGSPAVRRFLVSGVLLACLGTLGGCDSDTTGGYVPDGGVDATHGSVMLQDVWIDAPHGAPAGADTGLHMYLDNGSNHRDALVKVSTPIARSVRLMRNGDPVTRLPIGVHQARDLEWRTDHDGVELLHLRHAVEPGQWYPITFTFTHSPVVRMRVTIAPLGDAHPR